MTAFEQAWVITKRLDYDGRARCKGCGAIFARYGNWPNNCPTKQSCTTFGGGQAL